MKKKAFPLAAGAIVGGLVLAVVGGATLVSADAKNASTDSSRPMMFNGAEFLRSTQMDDAWSKDLAVFPKDLAGDDQWVTETPAYLEKKNEINEVGVTSMALAFYWSCSWENEFLAAFDAADEDRKATALQTLSEFNELPAVQEHFPDVDVWSEAIVAPAAAGDPTAMRADFGMSCDLYREGNAQ